MANQCNFQVGIYQSSIFSLSGILISFLSPFFNLAEARVTSHELISGKEGSPVWKNSKRTDVSKSLESSDPAELPKLNPESQPPLQISPPEFPYSYDYVSGYEPHFYHQAARPSDLGYGRDLGYARNENCPDCNGSSLRTPQVTSPFVQGLGTMMPAILGGLNIVGKKLDLDSYGSAYAKYLESCKETGACTPPLKGGRDSATGARTGADLANGPKNGLGSSHSGSTTTGAGQTSGKKSGKKSNKKSADKESKEGGSKTGGLGGEGGSQDQSPKGGLGGGNTGPGGASSGSSKAAQGPSSLQEIARYEQLFSTRLEAERIRAKRERESDRGKSH
jgi:hypothetical protein